MPSQRTYKVERGLAQMLDVGLDTVLAKEVEVWKTEVNAGVISEQARQVFVALGWMTQRDPRVKPADGRSPATAVRRPRSSSPGQVSADTVADGEALDTAD